jgi:hypothetical protein
MGLSPAKTRKRLSVKSRGMVGLPRGSGYGTTWGTISVMQACRRLARSPALRNADSVDSMDVKITAIFNLEFASPAAGFSQSLAARGRTLSTVGDISFYPSRLEGIHRGLKKS